MSMLAQFQRKKSNLMLKLQRIWTQLSLTRSSHHNNKILEAEKIRKETEETIF